MIQSRKSRVTIAWNPHGFHLINALPKGIKFSSNYSIHEILTSFLEWYDAQFGVAQQNLVIETDDARPHTAKVVSHFCDENEITVALHPPCSLDLAPSDFDLFGFLKDRLKTSVNDEPDELLALSRQFWKTLSAPPSRRLFVIR
jgi:hypothetical protein